MTSSTDHNDMIKRRLAEVADVLGVALAERDEALARVEAERDQLKARLAIYEENGHGVVPVSGGRCLEVYQDGKMVALSTSGAGDEAFRLRTKVSELEAALATAKVERGVFDLLVTERDRLRAENAQLLTERDDARAAALSDTLALVVVQELTSERDQLKALVAELTAKTVRYARAIELLRMLDTQASFRGARNPDVAAFLEEKVAP